MMSSGLVSDSYQSLKDNTTIYGYYSAKEYVRKRRNLEDHNVFFFICNCVIFGIIALIGCFKPWASFLPLAWIAIRLIYVIIRNRIG